MADSPQPSKKSKSPFSYKPTYSQINNPSDESIPIENQESNSESNPSPWTKTNTIGIIGIIVAILLAIVVVPYLSDQKIKENVKTQWIEAGKFENNDEFAKAIEIYSAILGQINKKNFPFEYASTQFSVGIDYLQLSKSVDKEKNLKNSIYSFDEALSIFDSASYPDQHAGVENNLGIAYAELSDIRDSESNIRKAIDAYNEALNYYTPEKNTIVFGGIKNNLGQAYLKLSDLDKENSSEYFEKAKTTIIEGHFFNLINKNNNPYEFATSIYDYGFIANSFDEKNRSFFEALNVFTIEDYPDEYARTWIAIGDMYFEYSPPLNETFTQKSIDSYNEAVTIDTIDKSPTEYAYIQERLGLAYTRMAMIKDRENYFDKANESFYNALKIYTIEDYPLDFADVQMNIGVMYTIIGDVKNNLIHRNLATQAYSETFKIVNPEKYPTYYQTVNTSYNLFLTESQ